MGTSLAEMAFVFVPAAIFSDGRNGHYRLEIGDLDLGH
jgi:hypothetical protein